jgi:alkanesulfonate monooxygenase SsuD/methylene tetrahydromethanopterin reductase-like flavin-dependent oxidoreductase (luciferase family)
MKPTPDDTRRQLGELGAMAHQVEQAERKILENAEKRLEHVQKVIEHNRGATMSGDPDAVRDYMDAIAERGRLQQVIAQARQHLN